MSNSNFHDPLERIETSYNTPLHADISLHGSRVKINQAVVKSIEPLTYDTYKLVLETENKVDINAQAGQYATIRPKSLDLPRSYSFARAPSKEKEGQHTFFIRTVPDGQFSEWLQQGKKCLEETVVLSGPMGDFSLDSSDDTIIAIAGGSGMSAIYALLEDACEKQIQRDALFLYGARSQRDLYLLEEIEEIKNNWNPNSNFEFIPVLSEEPEDSEWKGATGFVTMYFKEQYIDAGKINIEKAKAFFCGPPPMIDNGVEVLTASGMSEKNIFFDKFEDATSPAPVVDNEKCILCDECLLVKPVPNCIVEVATIQKNGKDSTYKRISPLETPGLYYTTLYVDEKECIRCYACVNACPTTAIHPDNKTDTLILANVKV